LFTEYFLRGIYGEADDNKDGDISVKEIKKYLDLSMSRAARRTFGRDQVATILGDESLLLASLAPGESPSRPSISVPEEGSGRLARLTPPESGEADDTSPNADARKQRMATTSYPKPPNSPQQGNRKSPPFAASFFGNSNEERAFAKKLVNVVSTDLERSEILKSIDKPPIVQTASALPKFNFWRTHSAQYLISLNANKVPDGRLRVEFRLWDVNAEQQMIGHAYFTVPDNWRRVAHIVADTISKRITGDSGYFDTHIVYVAESGPSNRRVQRLAIMDQDGENHRYLTDGSVSVLTPRFSPTLQEITYSSNYGGKYNAYIFNLDTGRQARLGDFQGESFTPRFSPDGGKVALSIAVNDNYDIHAVDLRSRQLKRLTNHSAMDIEPSYSPDGKWIVFNSDRSGSQQLHVMDASGHNIKMISSGQGRYVSPEWSPRGDIISFVKYTGGNFFIGIMRPDGSGERLIIDGEKPFNPAWAPNGRAILFSREIPGSYDEHSRLFVYNITSDVEYELPTPSAAVQADWSPFIP